MEDEKPLFRPEEFAPSLSAIFQDRQPNHQHLLRVAIEEAETPEREPHVPASTPRGSIPIGQGEQAWIWEVSSLQELFRGDKQPPDLERPLPEDAAAFYFIEIHTLEYSDVFGDRRDLELREVYSQLRRRPDGRSLGPLHDYLWRASALLLGMRPVSPAEFEAIMGRLEQSCRRFAQGPTSRNYMQSLRRMFTR